MLEKYVHNKLNNFKVASRSLYLHLGRKSSSFNPSQSKAFIEKILLCL